MKLIAHAFLVIFLAMSYSYAGGGGGGGGGGGAGGGAGGAGGGAGGAGGAGAGAAGAGAAGAGAGSGAGSGSGAGAGAGAAGAGSGAASGAAAAAAAAAAATSAVAAISDAVDYSDGNPDGPTYTPSVYDITTAIMATGNVFDYAIVDTELTLEVKDEFDNYYAWQSKQVSNIGEEVEIEFETVLPANSVYRFKLGETLPGYSCSLDSDQGITSTNEQTVSALVKCHSRFADGVLSSIWPRSVGPGSRVKLSGVGLAEATIQVNGIDIPVDSQTENVIYFTAPELSVGNHQLEVLPNGQPANQLYSLVYNAIQVETLGGGMMSHCGLLDTGKIACWGIGRQGQFPDPDPEQIAGHEYDYSSAVEVKGDYNAIAISKGDTWHSCFVENNGEVSCFGPSYEKYIGYSGELYDVDDPVIEPLVGIDDSPKKIAGIDNAVAVATGIRVEYNSQYRTFIMKACAVLDSGALRCWDKPFDNIYNFDNARFEITELSTLFPLQSSSLPTPVHTLAGFENVIDVSLAHGSDNLCALRGDGQIQCMGNNEFGQLGDGTTNDSLEQPVFVSGINNAVSLSFNGETGCAVLDNGRAKCWGKNNPGDFLETGGTAFSSQPVVIASQTNLIGRIAIRPPANFQYAPEGFYKSGVYFNDQNDPVCAVKATGFVTCWGGDFSQEWYEEISNTPNVAEIQTNSSNRWCLLLDEGNVRCTQKYRPLLDSEINQIEGEYVSYAGYNANYGVGREYYQNSPQAVTIAGVSDASKVVLSSAYSSGSSNELMESLVCALTQQGEVYCWGNTHTMLDRDLPVAATQVSGLTNVVDIAAPERIRVGGGGRLIALDTNGDVYKWDGGTLTLISSGIAQLGNYGDCGITVDGAVKCFDIETGLERVIAGIENAQKITGRCALDAEGQVYCWTNTGTEAIHKPITGAFGFDPVVVDVQGSCARYETGYVHCWDFNENSGEIKVNQKTGLEGIVQFAESFDYDVVCGLDTDHQMVCKAPSVVNSVGQFGTAIPIGTSYNFSFVIDSGVKVGSVKTFAQRDELMCAVLNDGAVQCWGSNARGAFAELPTRDRAYLEAPVMAHPKYLGLQQVDQPDRLAPFIAVVGESLLSVLQGTGYLDLGAVAFDDMDGRVSVTADNNVDTSVLGKYRVTYTATDAAGNARTAVRTVMVTETFVEGSGAAVTDAIVYKIDDQDAGVSVINRTGFRSGGTSYVNGRALLTYDQTYTIGSPEMNAGSYVEYDLSLLPNAIAGYRLTMNAPANPTYCDALSYQILNEQGELIDSFLVDHRESPISIGVAALNSQYKIRIDSDSSQCSTTNRAFIDELQIQLIAEFDAQQMCSASNDDGNVVDVASPNLCLQGEQTMVINEGEAFIDPGAIAIDGRDGVVNVSTTNAVDYKTPGTYTIYYSSADSAGNTVSKSRTVEVLDTTAPDIMLRGELVMRLKEGDAFIDPGASALDNVDGYVDISATGVVDTSTAGWYPLVYSMTDAAGNTSSITRSVIVEWANGVGNAEGVTLAIDNSDPAFEYNLWDESFAIADGDFYFDPETMMTNGNYAVVTHVNTSLYRSNNYYQYNLSDLPEDLGTYELRMNTVAIGNHCQKLSYQVLDPADNIVETFFVSHKVSQGVEARSLYIGQTELSRNFKIRIDSLTSDCGTNSWQAYLDQLEVRGIGPEDVRESAFSGVLKIDNLDPEFSLVSESNRNIINTECSGASCALFNNYRQPDMPPEVFEYTFSGLPNELYPYEMIIHTYSSEFDTSIPGIFELLDENGVVIKGRLDWEGGRRLERRTALSNNATYVSQLLGEEVILKRGYKLRITPSNINPDNYTRLWLDELELIQGFKDIFAPMITMLGVIVGEETVEVEQGTTYLDAGVLIYDNLSEDDVTLDVSSNVDTNLPGTYQVVYTATDMSGNVSTKTRTVEVVAPAVP